MKHFYSLSKFPGKTGEINYSTFFALKDLSYTYTALKCTDIIQGIAIIKQGEADGVSISMPFKSSVISLLDHVEPLVTEFNSCNTVVLLDGEYVGYNTDYYGVLDAIESIPNYEPVSILGGGSIGLMFKKMLGDRATVYSRSIGNWENRDEITKILKNRMSRVTELAKLNFEIVKEIIDLNEKERNRIPKNISEKWITKGEQI